MRLTTNTAQACVSWDMVVRMRSGLARRACAWFPASQGTTEAPSCAPETAGSGHLGRSCCRTSRCRTISAAEGEGAGAVRAWPAAVVVSVQRDEAAALRVVRATRAWEKTRPPGAWVVCSQPLIPVVGLDPHWASPSGSPEQVRGEQQPQEQRLARRGQEVPLSGVPAFPPHSNPSVSRPALAGACEQSIMFWGREVPRSPQPSQAPPVSQVPAKAQPVQLAFLVHGEVVMVGSQHVVVLVL